MTREEVISLMQHLKQIFATVRLVSPTLAICMYEEDGDLHASQFFCFETWRKEHHCENCISAKAMMSKGTSSKFEFSADNIYYAVAKYIEMDSEPYTLELVSHAGNDIVFDVFGKEKLIRSINSYNKKLYIDSLTQAYNRRYYEEHLQNFSTNVGVTMIDIDNFKEVNDTYGHTVGDQVLRTIVSTIYSNVRKSDVIVRFGGDEFLLIINGISARLLPDRLNAIRENIAAISFPDYPDLKLSVSIGAVYANGDTDELVKRADEQLYIAKEIKNTVKIEVGA